MTPEGKVKKAVKDLLDPLRPRVWYDMPVPGGFGKSTLDFLGSAYGHPFAIETKAADGKVTQRQWATIATLHAAGIEVFVIAGGATMEHDLSALDLWLKAARLDDRAGEVSRLGLPPPVVIDEIAEIDPEVYRTFLQKTKPKKSLAE